jgi:hypothetical protein
MKNMAFLIILLQLAAANMSLSCSDSADGRSAGKRGIDNLYSRQEDLSTERDDEGNGFFAWDSLDDQVNISGSDTGNGVPAGKQTGFTLSWLPNREKFVNGPGGGYIIYISNKKNCPPEKAMRQRVPYSSGDLAPTEAVVMLAPGTWYIKVAGYSRLNGGTAGVPSDEITVQARGEKE